MKNIPELFTISAAREHPAYVNIHVALSKVNCCANCGRCSTVPVIINPKGNVQNVRKRWPDILACWGIHSILVNSRVANDLADNNVTGYQLHELEDEFTTKELIGRPTYWIVEALSSVAFAPKCDAAQRAYMCSICGRLDYAALHANAVQYPEESLDCSSWNGDDFVWCVRGFASPALQSSLKVLELSRKYKWKNCKFSLWTFPQLCHFKTYSTDGIRIDHSKAHWQKILEQDIARREAELLHEKTGLAKIEP